MRYDFLKGDRELDTQHTISGARGVEKKNEEGGQTAKNKKTKSVLESRPS